MARLKSWPKQQTASTRYRPAGEEESGVKALIMRQTASMICAMPLQDDSTESHIRQLMQGRNVEESFHWLFLRYHSAVSGFFFRKGFSSEDCRDLTQDVFFAVYTGVKNLRSEAAFVGWLFSIAHNTALRCWERQKKQARLQLVAASGAPPDDEPASEVERVAAPDPDPLSQILHLETVEVVGEALSKLPGREQECLKASLVDNLSYREIGERLGISENTVAVHIHRAMKSLRKLLKGDQPSDRPKTVSRKDQQ